MSYRGKNKRNPNDYFPSVHNHTYHKGSLYEYTYIAGSGVKRSRNKCIHYESESKWCDVLKASCVGPSNDICTHYATNREEETETNVKKSNISTSIFFKMISIDEIVLDGKTNIPTLGDVNYEKNFYLKNRVFTAPVLVVQQSNRYILKDSAQVFFAARSLEISMIPCELYTDEDTARKLRYIRTKGKKVYLREYNQQGKIIDFSYYKVFIVLNNGKTISYAIHDALSKSLIQFI
ncbi:hypothetical protein [Ruminococcus albus]|uniref:hypothetical protein n=1 Tax=Ruminococcus albus TaxID=1264 RepID=UPI0004662E9F|nr:hypothetical protein [Ruminococcus albus]